MSQRELLIYVIGVLEKGGIPYMVTGSTVSSLQGRPRSTHDIDIVVGIRPSAIAVLLTAFAPPRFYLEESAIRDAIANCSMFNAIDSEGGDKIDFWMLSAEEFAQASFRRRIREEAAGVSMYVSQPEDTILSKLKWAKESGGSEKQMGDCVAVFEVNRSVIDMEYLEQWARKLGVEDLWKRVRESAVADD